MNEEYIEIDDAEMTAYIANKTGLDEDVVALVLNAEIDYLKEVGVIESEEE